MTVLLPLLSTSFIVISAILVALGWYFIRKGKRETHQKLMVSAAVSATLFFIVYISRTVFIGNIDFAGPDHVKPIYLLFLLFHIVLSTVGGVMGIITLILAFKGKLSKHRKIGPWTAVVWFCTAFTGFTVFYLLFIKYPGGEITSLIDAIF